MTEGRIFRGDDVKEDLVLTPDVCVVGSGAGGAVVAHELAKAGKAVVVLEEGGYHTHKEFDMQESHAFPMLYQDRGNRATADLAITILQGRAVGGSTVVNWTTCFRTPAHVLAHWRDVYRLEQMKAETLEPHWKAVEERLNIAPWALELVNANNRVIWDGCEKLGWAKEVLHRNVKGCMNSGYCGMGCPVNAKQSMLVTFIPDAVKLGATFYADTRAETLETDGRKVVAVHATVRDSKTGVVNGRRITVRPKLAVLSGGALNTPALLLRSKLDPSGRTGKRTFLHPVVLMSALMPHKVEGFYGAPQSVASHHFARREGKVGYFIETPPIHPMLASTAFTGFGAAHEQFMAQLPNINALIAITIDGFLPGDEGGTVTLRPDGRLRIDYPLKPENWEAFRDACKNMARIQFAAGAKAVVSMHNEPLMLERPADIDRLDAMPWEPNRVSIFTAHQMGGCAMGVDPKTSVVDPTLKHHAFDNLFVVDGSVLPTSLGVNPQLTVYGLSHWAAGHVAQAA